MILPSHPHPHGSARLADDFDLERSGLLGPKGLQFGYWRDTPLRIDSDAPALVIGGAGAGKLVTLLAYMACDPNTERVLWFDPRGEISAISIHNAARTLRPEYRWNPTGLKGPQHRCNPLDVLDPASPTFTADALYLTRNLIPLREGGKEPYFTLRAQDWVGGAMRTLALRDGQTDLPTLFAELGAVESDRTRWAALAQFMLECGEPDLRRIVGEMLAKQEESPREFGAIMGEIYANLAFLADPMLADSLTKPDFSLSALSDPATPCNIGIMCPVEYIRLWSPVLRLMFAVTKLYKQRRPDGPRITMVVDEAGQMGHFDALLEAFTFGRGAGVRAIAVFQDIGQIVRNFGAAAVHSFIGSAQTRLFMGVRDFQTAQLVSQMLGDQTIHVDDPLVQEAARHAQIHAAQRIFEDQDYMGAAFDYAYQETREQYQRTQRRALMSPDEVLAMPDDRHLLFISGMNVPPILGHRYRYFERREMAGLYLPNPNHPPADSVLIRTRWGGKRAPIVSERVPPQLARLPQYQTEPLEYVQGFRPC